MDVFEKAVRFAVQKHSGQVRKLGNAPYILHPLEVASIVGTMTSDREILAAAVLHDTVEDTDTTIEEIREEFGQRVAALVTTETEDKREDKPPQETWELRKQETLLILRDTTETGVKMMWLGDKLSNIRSFHREYEKNGHEIWNAMNQKDPKKQGWYYSTVGKYLKDLEQYSAYKEYVSHVNYIFKDFPEVLL